MSEQNTESDLFVKRAVESAIRIGLILVLVVACLNILGPFLGITIWGLVLAVAFAGPFEGLKAKLGGNNKLAATLFAVISLAVIIIPMIALTGTLVNGVTSVSEDIEAGTLTIAPPRESVKEWPVIGKKSYEFWLQASTDLDSALDVIEPHLQDWGESLVGVAKSTVASVLAFALSLVIAAVLLAHREQMRHATNVVLERFAGERGAELVELSAGTIKSVAVGVIGIAIIQAVLGGLGMLVMGIPAAGLWALVILVLVIAQLPAIIVLGPVIVYAYSVADTVPATIFAIWSVAVAMSDLVLKPMLLGRGVKVPMLVILLGAIGGMMSAGIIGLFIGAVLLAVSYQMFIFWLEPTAAAQSANVTAPSAEVE